MTDSERLRHSYIRAALTGLLGRGITSVDGKDVAAFAVDVGERCLREAEKKGVSYSLAARELREIRDMAHRIATGQAVPGDDAKAVARHIVVIAERELEFYLLCSS